MEATVSLLVADANEEYRHQFIEMLQAEPDLQVVGETGDGLVLLDQLKTLRPDVVVPGVEWLIWPPLWGPITICPSPAGPTQYVSASAS